MKRLVITCNPNLNHQQIEQLRKSFELTAYDEDVGRTNFDEAIRRLLTAEIAIVNSFTPLPDIVLSKLPHLKVIISDTAGIDHIDLESVNRQGIILHYYQGYCARTLAEKSLAYILIAQNKIIPAIASVKKGSWDYNGFQGREMRNKNILILGLGGSGSILKSFLEAMGAQVSGISSKTSRTTALKLAKDADIISVHMPLTETTIGYIDRGFLAECKPNVTIINLARGKIIDNYALAAFLKSHPAATACLDVLDTEPPPQEHPLLNLENAIITPHIGWNSAESDEFLANAVYSDAMKYQG